MLRCVPAILVAGLAAGCATVERPDLESGGLTIAQQEQAQAQVLAVTPQTRELKRKVAIGRFTNVTRYGRTLLGTAESDPLANQAADILTNRLVETGRFLVVDRPSIQLAERLDAISEQDVDLLSGVDAIVVGSVTQFGRREEGRTGFLSSTRRQIVEATVEARLVDARTGRVFFTATGSGEASVEAGEVAGFGSRAAYDATLNDRAIAAAIADLMSNVLQRLSARRWSTDVLDVRQGQVLISGGPSVGLRVGDRLRLVTRGESVASASTGAIIDLPGEALATIEVVEFFGDDPEAEGAVATLVAGRLPGPESRASLRVEEIR